RNMSQKSYEVAVIGGGIVGSCVAYFIAESGLDCVLIEKDDIASGTSSRCDGNVSIVDKDPGYDSQLSWLSQEIMEDLQTKLDIPFEFREHGSILVCDNEQEMEACTDWVKKQKDNGLKFNVLTPK